MLIDIEIRRILNLQLFKNSPDLFDQPSSTQHYDGHHIISTAVGNIESSPTLKDHIQNVLKMDDKQHFDLEHTFNIANPDPMYVFVLPGSHHNRTVVFRRSNFDAAIFPNISNLQRQIMASNITRLYTLIENIEKIRPVGWDLHQHPPEQPTPPSPTPSYRNNRELTETDSMRVVEENVRTEKNFLKFMNYLNDHQHVMMVVDNSIDSTEVTPKTNKHGSSSYNNNLNRVPLKSSASQIEYSLELAYSSTAATSTIDNSATKKRISWKDLGLDGWIGGIKEPGKDFDDDQPEQIVTTTEKTTPTSYFFYQKGRSGKLVRPTMNNKKMNQIQSTSIHYNMEEVAPVSISSTTPATYRPAKSIATSAVQMQHESWDVPMKIPHELNDLLNEEHLQLHNASGILKTTQPKWPVTSSRASHKDEDVFIARANNPFGHSTKWTWR